MTRRRSAAQKLIGWGILAGAIVVFIGIFLITRAVSPSGSAPSSSSAAAVATASSQAPAASPPTTAVVDAAAMDQSARKDFLNKLIGQGVLMGVEPFGPPAKVGVTPLFQGLNPDLQLQFLAVVYAYVHAGLPSTDPLQVIDSTNGKVIGTFTNDAGLKTL